MLLAEQVSLTNVVALHGVSLAGERRRGADPKRLPVWVWWRLLRTGRIGHRHHGEPDTSHDSFEHCSLPFLSGQALGMRDDRGGSVCVNSGLRCDKWSPAGFRLLRIAAAD